MLNSVFFAVSRLEQIVQSNIQRKSSPISFQSMALGVNGNEYSKKSFKWSEFSQNQYTNTVCLIEKTIQYISDHFAVSVRFL